MVGWVLDDVLICLDDLVIMAFASAYRMASKLLTLQPAFSNWSGSKCIWLLNVAIQGLKMLIGEFWGSIWGNPQKKTEGVDWRLSKCFSNTNKHIDCPRPLLPLFLPRISFPVILVVSFFPALCKLLFETRFQAMIWGISPGRSLRDPNIPNCLRL